MFQFLPHVNASVPLGNGTFLIPVRRTGEQEWLDMEIVASDVESLKTGLEQADAELAGWVEQNPVVAIAEVRFSVVSCSRVMR